MAARQCRGAQHAAAVTDWQAPGRGVLKGCACALLTVYTHLAKRAPCL
jgi:hypothetical protein